jgi:hypothetical protein
MIVALLGMAILAGLVAAGVTLALGQGIVLALAAYVLVGSVALVLAGLALAGRPRAPDPDLQPARPS